MTNTLQPGRVCAHLGSALQYQVEACPFVYCTRRSLALRFYIVVSEIAQVGQSSSSQQHRPCWEHSPSTLALLWGTAGRRWNNPPIISQPLSLLQSLSVMCLGGTYRKWKSKRWDAQPSKYTPNYIQVFGYLAARLHLLQEFIFPLSFKRQQSQLWNRINSQFKKVNQFRYQLDKFIL